MLGVIGMKKAAELGGRGMAVGGIITGALAFLGAVVMYIGAAIWWNSATSDLDQFSDELDRINQELLEDLENLDTGD